MKYLYGFIPIVISIGIYIFLGEFFIIHNFVQALAIDTLMILVFSIFLGLKFKYHYTFRRASMLMSLIALTFGGILFLFSYIAPMIFVTDYADDFIALFTAVLYVIPRILISITLFYLTKVSKGMKNYPSVVLLYVGASIYLLNFVFSVYVLYFAIDTDILYPFIIAIGYFMYLFMYFVTLSFEIEYNLRGVSKYRSLYDRGNSFAR